MNKIKQQFLFTALLLLCCTLNTSAEIKSGKCGDNVSFSLDTSTGLLSITGTGEMWDFTSSTNTPWYSNYSSIKNVRISAGVTSIGKYAFYGCELTSISISEGVTSIGAYSFSNCSNITAIELPSTVNFIGDHAFGMASKLETINIPEGVTALGTTDKSQIFNGTAIKSITIPSSVKIIGTHCFFMCKSLETVNLSEGLETIGHNAFYDCALTSVTIPNSVKTIDVGAFDSCELTDIVVGTGVTSISANAFYGHFNSITWNATECSYDGRTDDAYWRPFASTGTTHTTVTIGDNVKTIPTFLFYGLSSLKSITIPASVTTIGDKAFQNCNNLDNVYSLSNTPPTIYSNTFNKYSTLHVKAGCKNQYSAQTYWKNNFTILDDIVTSVSSISLNTTTSKMVVGGTMTISVTYTPSDADNRTVTWKSSNTAVATVSSTGVVTAVAPGTATITATSANGKTASCEINALYYKVENEVNKTAKVVYGAIKYSGDVVIPEKVYIQGVEYDVVEIGDHCFGGCSGLTYVSIPASITYIDEDAFLDCENLSTVNFANVETMCNMKYNDDDDGECFPFYYAEHLHIGGKEVKDIVIPNSVTSIGASAFRYCSGLTSVTIPNSVTSIGASAFRYCSGLTSIVIPNSVTSISNYTFCGCSALISVTIPNTVTSIGNSAFSGCSGLTSMNIPNSVTSIGGSAFQNCSGLTSVTIPNGVVYIHDYAFYYCSRLTSVTIPSTVTSIGEFAFRACSRLTSVTIPNSVRLIYDDAFSDCSGLTSITCESTTPPTCYSYTFGNVDKSIPVYVPEASVAAYKAATVWKNFTNIQAIESTGTSLVPFGKDSADEYVTVYNLSGGIVNTSVKVREIKQLPKGVYIVKGTKIVVE